MNYSFEHLRNKTCVITGGAGVIGQSLGMGLAQVGINIAILDLSEEAAKNTASIIKEKYKVDSIGLKADVLDINSVKEANKTLISKYGKIDFLINGAGGNSPKSTSKVEFIEDHTDLEDTFFGLDVSGFDWVFDLNFKGTLIPTMVIAKEMVKNKEGVVLNISSMNSFRPLTKIPAYSAAKASINNFTEWLAVHLAKVNVRVNAIAPGFFVTNQNRFLLFDQTTNELTARGKKIIDLTPQGKFGNVDDLVGTTLFLLSDLSSFITGVVIPIDGGFNAYSGV